MTFAELYINIMFQILHDDWCQIFAIPDESPQWTNGLKIMVTMLKRYGIQ